MSELMPVFLRHMYPYVFETMELPPAQVLAIITIDEKKICSLGDLAKELHVAAPTVTGIVDRLQRDGYLTRIPDEVDRRVTNIQLTKKGKKIAHKFRGNIKKRWEYILAKLPPEIQEGPVNLIRRLTQGFTDGTI
jgi:DNA-binding MarR family transcriptional regulator